MFLSVVLIILKVLAGLLILLGVIAMIKKPSSIYKNQPDQQNPMEGMLVDFVEDKNDEENADGVRGHLVATGKTQEKRNAYCFVKRVFDIVLSFGGLVILSPVFLVIIIAIIIDDPGPVFFLQKRIGVNKQNFCLHKFRSMKMSTPPDVPTHMLDNPEQYITRVGKFLRAHSLDELPQIWDIFISNMSVIGPRPALWNQDVLTAERDKYGANDVKPGLTGWAQINGRDKLGISEKALIDGDYVQNQGFKMDCKCFIGTILLFGSGDTIVEGRACELKEDEGRTKE